MKALQRYKRALLFIFSLILLLSLCPVTVNADIGPKPSVKVKVRGLENETYYITLLSKSDSTGPWSTTSDMLKNDSEQSKAVWDAFRGYKDSDGFYFIGYFENCTGANVFKWTYYPPEQFKILIYLPDSKKYIVSTEIYERYAFDSVYKVTVQDGKINSAETLTIANEMPHFLARLLLTLVIELTLALFFGYRKKLQLLIIVAANIVTQLFLNLILYAVVVTEGANDTYKDIFVALEILIFIIEGLIYRYVLTRGKLKTDIPSHPWIYSFCANLTSFVVGLVMTSYFPTVF